MTWTPLWRQAHTAGLPLKLFSGKNHTVVWDVPVYAGGDALRVSFLNHYGKKATKVKAMAVKIGDTITPITKNGKTSFKIKAGERLFSDEITVDVPEGATMQVRICMADKNADNNMTEEFGMSYKGNLVMDDVMPNKTKNKLLVDNGVYYPVPAVEGIEVRTKNAPKVIAAFGDSITSMSRWTVPLAKRLHDTYGDEYVLVNEAILGNCHTYEKKGSIWSMFGEKGVNRIQWDLEGLDLHTVMFTLGTNDFSYANKDHREELSAENVIAAVEKTVKELKAKGIRVTSTTLAPRFGYFGVPKFDDYMNEQRKKYNDWVRTTDLFDYYIDADELLKDPEKPDWFNDEYHQGDHLHPNAAGGQLLADNYDLAKLVGKE